MSDPLSEVTAALEDLRARVARVEAGTGSRPEPAPGPGDAGTHWLLAGLARNTGPGFARDGISGSVAYGGRVRAPGTGDVVWQLEHAALDVVDADLDAAAATLAAVAHPFRLRLLRRMLQGASTLAELQEPAAAGTTGQLHHHLRELRSAGLVVSRRRNHSSIPTDRVVPVLVMITAALGRDLGTDGDPAEA
jgi:hypothetical protein